MMKVMFKLISVSLLWLLSFWSKSETISIQSIQTTEGAELNCTNDSLILNIGGETFQVNIAVSKESDRFKFVSTTQFYNVPFYVTDPKSETVFITNNTYFVKNNKVISGASLEDFYEDVANGELSTISKALNEVHKNKKCLSWSFK